MSPKIRQTIYAFGTLISAVLGIALIWGGVNTGTADNANQIIAGLLALLGGGAPAVAASTVAKQTKAGAFDNVPVAEQAISAIQKTIEKANTAQNDVQRVTQAITDALTGTIGTVVGATLGPVAGSLARQVMDSVKR
jgi:hypothetical protein